jgi:hypothetical protein
MMNEDLKWFLLEHQSKQRQEKHRDRPFIRDVNKMEVRSSDDDAIELLNMDLQRRRIAHTQLNTKSSRFHHLLSMPSIR